MARIPDYPQDAGPRGHDPRRFYMRMTEISRTTVARNWVPSPHDVAVVREYCEIVRQIVQTLPVRERIAVIAYFGFDGQTIPLKTIAKLLGVTKERARQVRDRGIRLLSNGHRRERLREVTVDGILAAFDATDPP